MLQEHNFSASKALDLFFGTPSTPSGRIVLSLHTTICWRPHYIYDETEAKVPTHTNDIKNMFRPSKRLFRQGENDGK